MNSKISTETNIYFFTDGIFYLININCIIRGNKRYNKRSKKIFKEDFINKKKVFLRGLILVFCSMMLPITDLAEYGDYDDRDGAYAYISNSTFKMELATQLNQRDTPNYLNYGLLLRNDLFGIKKD